MKFSFLIYVVGLVWLMNGKLSFQQNLSINNGQFSLTYNMITCNLLNATNVPSSLKCLVLCQSVECQSVTIINGVCNLTTNKPQLIQYSNISGLTINYTLGKFQKNQFKI